MNPPTRIEVTPLFPTPVASLELPDSILRNAELAQVIRQRKAQHGSVQASNLGGWQSDWNMATWGGPRTAEILDIAKNVATQLTRDRQGRPVQIAWKINAWANVNGPGHANEFHCHPGAYWSGTYYVDDGGVAANPSLGGEFEMMDPRGPGPAMYAPALAFAGRGGLSLGASETVRPKAGLLMLFPAWLLHQVRPYRGTRERISIAFNLSV